MFPRTIVDFGFTMAASLALLGVLRALKIDSQLAVIKNDCYERLAIGQRHNTKDIYKTSHVTTVFECQLFCTEEKELCKSFSFGIGVKGNASCELSTDAIKETADLKPVGTKADNDYDLYIKKLGCTLVIDKNNPAFDHYKPQNKPESPYKPGSYDQPQSGNQVSASYKPVTEYENEKPVGSNYIPNKPESGYGSTVRPVYGKPQEVQHVQTLVSVSSGGNRPVLDPYHEILVGEGPYNYARPPFRPPSINHPYDKPSRPSRPNYDYDSRPGESNMVSYGHRPIPDKYGSYIPRPDHYNDYYQTRPDGFDRPDDYYRPNRPSDYYRPRPPVGDYGQRPRPPPDDYDQRPQRPLGGEGYDRPSPGDYNQRPFRPERPLGGGGYDRPNPDDYNQRPLRPERPLGGGDYDRPIPNDYNQRPHRPDRPLDYDRPKPPNGGYDRPIPPNDGYDRPNPPNNGYDRPRPPSSGYDRPKPPSSGYDRPDPPSSGYDRPKPPSSGYERPDPPSSGYDRPKPPSSGYDRPDPPSSGYDRPKPPSSGYDRPDPPSSGYDRPKPSSSGYDRPDSPSSGYDRPKPPSSGYDRPKLPSSGYDRPDPPNSGYDRPKPSSSGYDRPNPPSSGYDRPNPPSSGYDKPNPPNSGYDRPNPPNSGYDRPNPPSSGYDRPNPPSSGYGRPKPPNDGYKSSKPTNEYLFSDIDRYDSPSKPGYQKPEPKPGNGYNSIKDSSAHKDPHFKPIVTQSVGAHGESITSIITELDDACFRRVLAGKRVTRALVKRALFCERVEDCQRECAEEKRFACEGFNYRLDPSGRGKGECELLAIPLSHLDIGRDLYPDPDYDYYERDRNAASINCRGQSYYPPDNDGYYNRRHDQRPYDWWDEDRRYGNRRPRPDFGYDRPPYGYDGYRPNSNRRGDFAYHDSHHSEHNHNYHYEHYDHGPLPYDYKSYEPYLPVRRPVYDEDRYYNKHYIDRDRDKSSWGFTKPSWGSYGGSYGTNYNPHDYERRNYYLPPPTEGNKNWGQYGGSYGNGGLNLQYSGYGHSQSFDFWGLNKYEEKFHNYGELPPLKKPGGGSYLPELPQKPPSGGYIPERPYIPPSGSGGGNYLPDLPSKPPGEGYLPEPKPPTGGSYLPERPNRPPVSGGSYLPGKPNQDNDLYNNAILPAEPRYPYRYDFLKDECSLRSAAGFRLTKRIVKKFVSVPNIYECELLCFKEKEFPCASYAFRYTATPVPTENCYLSNSNYKELDFYTDLEPDRNFDVYTMNNMKKCEQPVVRGRDNSDCFWRVRSAQRLDHKVVRDSLTVKSIVECQVECLRCVRFTCRAFSFRYGSPVIGGPVDNCLLTDWPYMEMDPRIHFIPEPGFEIYERGSFGHGCEPHHFGITGRPSKNSGSRINQLCYIGYGAPARLLRQATRKELQVATEEECKAECSKLRENTLFQCMSLSYSTKSPKWEPNCKLSDILQRDLLPNVDYVPDPDSWLFAWDNYNPQCRAIANEPVHNNIGRPENRNDYDGNAIGTWRVYSVSGWPCRRGTLCRENRVAGFWFCELEGGDASAWDYCCRPDHQCGFSEGFQYQWCYVGPERTQWRKCSDRYYPYIHNLIDRFDRPPPSGGSNYLPEHRPPPYLPDQKPPYLPDQRPPHYLPDQRPPPNRPGIHPDRPPAPPTRPPSRPTLDEYEMQFENQFLDPPKPGGFGQPRHWPLSYLHKEMPPNNTDSDSRLMKATQDGTPNPKFAAIQNLIDVIKSNDLKNVQYQITNESNRMDDILFVKIPLPTNFTQETKNEKMVATESAVSDPVDLKEETKSNGRSPKSLPVQDRFVPVYRKGFITRTNVTNHRARTSRNL